MRISGAREIRTDGTAPETNGNFTVGALLSRSLSVVEPSLRFATPQNRRAANGEQVTRLAGLAMKRKPSVDFSGYWQRHEMKKAAN
jgi:hypothetical protein